MSSLTVLVSCLVFHDNHSGAHKRKCIFDRIVLKLALGPRLALPGLGLCGK